MGVGVRQEKGVAKPLFFTDRDGIMPPRPHPHTGYGNLCPTRHLDRRPETITCHSNFSFIFKPPLCDKVNESKCKAFTSISCAPN